MKSKNALINAVRFHQPRQLDAEQRDDHKKEISQLAQYLLSSQLSKLNGPLVSGSLDQTLTANALEEMDRTFALIKQDVEAAVKEAQFTISSHYGVSFPEVQ